MKVDIPGIGSSLGQCVVCGDTFALEVIMGKSVGMMRVKGIDANLPIHRKCKDKLPKDGDWKKLPAGPLREEFERVASEISKPKKEGS
jgi:hypothetical protein